MPFQRKLGLILLTMLSLVTMTASLMKTIQVRVSVGRTGDNTKDIQYRTSLLHVLLHVWAGVEQGLVITLGCVPSLRTWFKTVLPAFQSMTSSGVLIFTSRSLGSSTGSKADSNKPSSDRCYDQGLQPQMHHYHVSVEGIGD
ncbi:hypothetical protein PG994_014115 [Apiospora phragmitis]|uniref:Uncharacterized protein n=1 Tax=Apiospora phragmitis TaxID=2905665 RepID=A0ABR1T3E7_9PEZI